MIHAFGDEQTADELNQFIGSIRVLAVDRQFVNDGPQSCWAICVSYDEGGSRAPQAKRGKADYKDILTPPRFAVFARLRALRKDMSEAEGVPAYAVFTNDQLAEMVVRPTLTSADMGRIAGVGDARLAKYGASFLAILTEAALPARSGIADEA